MRALAFASAHRCPTIRILLSSALGRPKALLRGAPGDTEPVERSASPTVFGTAGEAEGGPTGDCLLAPMQLFATGFIISLAIL
jgi:hypothetical protein